MPKRICCGTSNASPGDPLSSALLPLPTRKTQASNTRPIGKQLARDSFTHGPFFIGQFYFNVAATIAAWRTGNKILSLPEGIKATDFFKVTNLFSVVIISSFVLLFYPLLNAILSKLENLAIEGALCCKEKNPKPALYSLARKKGGRLESLILAFKYVLAYACIAPGYFKLNNGTAQAQSYQQIEQTAVDYTRTWLLFANLALTEFSAKDIIAAIEIAGWKYSQLKSKAITTCFGMRWTPELIPYKRIGDRSDTNSTSPKKNKKNAFYYRHNDIAYAWLLFGCIAVAWSGIFSIMQQSVCELDPTKLLYILGAFIADNAGYDLNNSITYPNHSSLSCGINSAYIPFANIYEGLFIMGDSDDLLNNTKTIIELNTTSFCNNKSIEICNTLVDLASASNHSLMRLEVDTIPLNMDRLYGLPLALIQEIQSYNYIGYMFIGLFLITAACSLLQKRNKCIGPKYQAYSKIAAEFVTDVRDNFDAIKYKALGFCLVMFLLFREKGLLPNSKYKTSLWDDTAFSIGCWGSALLYMLSFQDMTQAYNFTDDSEEAFRLEQGILEWGTAWTFFLALIPVILPILAMPAGMKAGSKCIEVCRTDSMSYVRLYHKKHHDYNGESKHDSSPTGNNMDCVV